MIGGRLPRSHRSASHLPLGGRSWKMRGARLDEEGNIADYFLGFDPGGERNFGWCVCSSGSDNTLILVAAGNANHSKGAFDAAIANLPDGENPNGVGIDAPLFWVVDGGREADSAVRDAIGRAGAPNRSGTVQHFNSLQGSCVIQGMLIAQLLRARYPMLSITEAHPKALLWLLGIATVNRPAAQVPVDSVCLVDRRQFPGGVSEHVRDAVLGAATARAMALQEAGWVDLLEREEGAIRSVDGPLGYWMPVARYQT